MLKNYSKEELAAFKEKSKEELKKRIKEFEKTSDNMSKKIFKWVPKNYQHSWLNVIDGKASRQKAINLFCLECVGYSKKEVIHCNAFCCPLYNFRPFQKKS